MGIFGSDVDRALQEGQERIGGKRVRVLIPAAEGGEKVVEVGLNGRMYLLQLGQEALVPEDVAAVLRDAGLLKGMSA